MDAVILAAGESKRFFRHSGIHKLSIRIRKIPLICYPVTSLSLAGARDIVIIASRVIEPLIREALIHCPYSGGVSRVKINNETWRDNGYTLLLALEDIVSQKSLFMVSMSDHIYPPIMPLTMKEASLPCIGADSTPKFINVNEATKIRVIQNSIFIGKELENYDYIDVGLHRLSINSNFNKCRHEFTLKMSDLLLCIFSKDFTIMDFKGIPWIDIDVIDDYINVVVGRARLVIDVVIESWRTMGVTVSLG